LLSVVTLGLSNWLWKITTSQISPPPPFIIHIYRTISKFNATCISEIDTIAIQPSSLFQCVVCLIGTKSLEETDTPIFRMKDQRQENRYTTQGLENQKYTMRATDSHRFTHSAIPSTCPYTTIHCRQLLFLLLYVSTNLQCHISEDYIFIFTSMKTSNLTEFHTPTNALLYIIKY